MAPIATNSTGMMPQVLDDPKLIDLLSKLSSLDLVENEASLNQLTDLLEPNKSKWLFEETVRLVEPILQFARRLRFHCLTAAFITRTLYVIG
jgi:hypothetical protein